MKRWSIDQNRWLMRIQWAHCIQWIPWSILRKPFKMWMNSSLINVLSICLLTFCKLLCSPWVYKTLTSSSSFCCCCCYHEHENKWSRISSTRFCATLNLGRPVCELHPCWQVFVIWTAQATNYSCFEAAWNFKEHQSFKGIQCQAS